MPNSVKMKTIRHAGRTIDIFTNLFETLFCLVKAEEARCTILQLMPQLMFSVCCLRIYSNCERIAFHCTHSDISYDFLALRIWTFFAISAIIHFETLFPYIKSILRSVQSVRSDLCSVFMGYIWDPSNVLAILKSIDLCVPYHLYINTYSKCSRWTYLPAFSTSCISLCFG